MDDHPIRIHVRDDQRRSRLTVFFRLLLAVPHIFWLMLWGIVVFVLYPFVWLTALVIARLPGPIHRFYAAFLRYEAHVYAYVYLTANPFPGFTGALGSYPVEIDLPGEPGKQSRLAIFFRLLLAYPALVLAGIVGYLGGLAAFGGWWAALFTGRMPRGLRDVTAYLVRYNAQIYGYVLLLTGTYPNSSPVVGTLIEPPPAPIEPSTPAVEPAPGLQLEPEAGREPSPPAS
jgi:hypothetical protein